MKTMKELFEHQLKDLYNAEMQLINALPKMKSKAKDSALQEAFEIHLEETKRHQKMLEEICNELNISPKGEKCHAMEGLIKEAEGLIDEAENNSVMDAGLIADAQRIEHYEIAGYGTVVRYAKELGHDKIARQLQEILNDEYNADEKLSELAENRLNEKAIS